MIDHPEQVDRLLVALRAALPIRARMTPRLLATLRDQNPTLPIVAACRITRVDYAGDEGGITRHLAREGADESGRLVVTSITHLDFDPQLPVAYMDFPREHRAKIHSTNPIERLNGEIKRRTDVVGIFPNEGAITRLIGAILLEQSDEWATQRARYMTLEAISTVSNNATVRLSAVPA